MSTTRTTPQRVSMARRAAVSSAAGTDSAGRHFASVKCTCVFQKPAVTERPAPSSTVAPAGTRTPSRGPTDVMRPSVAMTAPFAMGGSEGEG